MHCRLLRSGRNAKRRQRSNLAYATLAEPFEDADRRIETASSDPPACR